MARRTSKNITGIPRIDGISPHDAWVSFTCIRCGIRNYEKIGQKLIEPHEAYNNSKWQCHACDYIHAKENELPFSEWPESATEEGGTPAERFWQAFFRSATEKPESYWKQCNACGRVLPNADFSRHVKWGPLEKQMECRACKAVINANLNPLRTTEQLRESAMKRRIAELLVSTSDEKLNVEKIFQRFGSKCFKTGVTLDIKKPATWQIDHTLPSKYFYPLSDSNATLLASTINQNKSDMWPSQFYTNEELVKLAKLTGASLELLCSTKPILNPNIDVNACVEKFLNVRGGSDLKKRVLELKSLLERHELSSKLSEKNKKLLGIK